MEFGKRFKYYRQKANLSQQEAAKQIGVKGYQLANYETDRSQPSLEVLLKMSKVYLVSVDRLLGNNMIANRYGKDPQNSDDYIDINDILKVLNDYVDQVNKSKKPSEIEEE